MKKLSISRAWDESRAIMAGDGRIMMTVTMALIVLPSTMTALASGRVPVEPGQAAAGGGMGVFLLSLVMVALIYVGLLSLVHIALTPGDTVAGAIRHGARRVLPVVAASLIVAIPFMLLVFGTVSLAVGPENLAAIREAASAGLPPPELDPAGVRPLVGWLLIFLLIGALYVGVRLSLVMPAGVAEKIGPVGMIKRSWTLAKGHFWRLFGFAVAFGVGVIIVSLVSTLISRILFGLILGAPNPWTVSALFTGLIESLVSGAVVMVYATMIARIYAQLAAQPTVPHVTEETAS